MFFAHVALMKRPREAPDLQAIRDRTSEMAGDLSDDLKHMRTIASRDRIESGDVRRLSALLRRFLIDGDIQKVANPRVGKVFIISPQLKPFYRLNEIDPFTLFSGGSVTLGQIKFSHYEVSNRITGSNFDPREVVSLSLDNFLSQRVICLHGKWATRREVIKFVANTAGGVHSDEPKSPVHQMLDNLRRFASLELTDGMPNIHLDVEAFSSDPCKVALQKREHLDIVHVQIMSCAQYVCQAPDIQKLEAVIDAE